MMVNFTSTATAMAPTGNPPTYTLRLHLKNPQVGNKKEIILSLLEKLTLITESFYCNLDSISIDLFNRSVELLDSELNDKCFQGDKEAIKEMVHRINRFAHTLLEMVPAKRENHPFATALYELFHPYLIKEEKKEEAESPMEEPSPPPCQTPSLEDFFTAMEEGFVTYHQEAHANGEELLRTIKKFVEQLRQESDGRIEALERRHQQEWDGANEKLRTLELQLAEMESRHHVLAAEVQKQREAIQELQYQRRMMEARIRQIEQDNRSGGCSIL